MRKSTIERWEQSKEEKIVKNNFPSLKGKEIRFIGDNSARSLFEGVISDDFAVEGFINVLVVSRDVNHPFEGNMVVKIDNLKYGNTK